MGCPEKQGADSKEKKKKRLAIFLSTRFSAKTLKLLYFSNTYTHPTALKSF